MSKKLKLGSLSATRTLRSATISTEKSSTETSPYFAGKKSTKANAKKPPIKIEHKNTAEDKASVTNTEVVSTVQIKNESTNESTNAKTIKTTKRKIKSEETEQTKDVKDVKIDKDECGDHDIDLENVKNIKQSQWMPSNWETILKNIREMRKHNTAPVDKMGCHECADPNASPSVSRYQSLVALMLSSQTKDQVTHAAMQRLNMYGCKPELIAQTSDDVLGKLIYPVGFWKVSTSTCIYCMENT